MSEKPLEALTVVQIPETPKEPPPDYFDISIVPRQSQFLPTEVPVPFVPSTVQTAEKNEGVYSNDSLLDHNPDELWKYFLTFATPPEVRILCRGYHYERKVTYTMEKDVNGKEHQVAHEETVQVDDFKFTLNCTNVSQPMWSCIAAKPIEGQFPSIRDVLEQYTVEDNPLKEIQMNKQLKGWDNARLCQNIKMLLKTVYPNEIDVCVQYVKTKVVAQSSSKWMSLCESGAVWCLLAITCLWLIVLPIYRAARKKIKNRLICEFEMKSDDQHFFNLFRNVIYDNGARRYFGNVTLQM